MSSENENATLDVRDGCTLQFFTTILPVASLATFLSAIFVSLFYEMEPLHQTVLSTYLFCLSVFYLFARFVWITRIRKSWEIDVFAIALFFAADIGSWIGVYLIENESFISVALKIVIFSLSIRRTSYYLPYIVGAISISLGIRALSGFAVTSKLFELLFVVPFFALMFRLGTEQVWHRVLLGKQNLERNLNRLEEEKRLREESERQLSLYKLHNVSSHITIDRLHSLISVGDLTQVVERLDQLRKEGHSDQEIERRIRETDLFRELVELTVVADVNQGMIDAIGADSKADFVQRFFQSFHPKQNSIHREFLINVALYGLDHEGESVHSHLKTGEQVCLHFQSTPVSDADRIYVITTSADVTEHVKLERQLQASESRLKLKVTQLERERTLREETEKQLALERDEYRTANLTLDMSNSLLLIEDLTHAVQRLRDLEAQGHPKEALEHKIQTTDFVHELSNLVVMVDCNSHWAKTIGAESRQEGIDRIMDTFVEESLPAYRDFFVSVLFGRDFEAENVHRHLKTGELLYFKIQARSFESNGKTIAIFNLTNLTEETELRKRLESSQSSLRYKVNELEKEKRLREETEIQLAEAKEKNLTASITLDMANTLVSIADATGVIQQFDKLKEQGLSDEDISRRLHDIEFCKQIHSYVRTLDINQRLADAVGADSREDAIHRFKHTFLPESYSVLADFLSSLLGGVPFEGANVHRNLKTGERLHFRVQSKPLYRGDRTYFVITFTETTAQDKMTRQQLAENEARMRLALEASKAVIWEVDIDSRTMSAGQDYHDMLGYPMGTFNGPISDVRGLVHPNDFDESRELTSSIILGEREQVNHCHRIRLANGSYRWFSFSMMRADVEPGAPKIAIGTLIDVHDSIRAKNLLQMERDVLASETDLDSKLNDLARGAEEIWDQARCAVHVLGPASASVVDCYAPSIGLDYAEKAINLDFNALPKSCRKAIRRAEFAFEPAREPWDEFGDYSWSASICEEHLARATVCLYSPEMPSEADKQLFEQFAKIVEQIILKDLQQKRAAEFESKMLTETKLDSLGKLAGGVAHDFNNLLTVIMTHAELIGLNQVNKDIERSSHQIVEAAEMASGLCQKMLTYSGEVPFELNDLDLSEEAESVFNMVQTGTTKRLHFSAKLAPNLPGVVGDRSMISQLILNLLTNAAEATSPGGQISLTTGKRILDENDLSKFYFSDWLEPGEYVFVRVQDNGSGIPGEIIERIFDPFFTTKKLGSGLGLATVVGAVRRHKGCLNVESKINEGTTITAFLPSSLVTTQNEPEKSIRLAVVDDQPAVLSAIEMILQKQGFAVVTMGSGEEAIERLEEIARCDALILDQQMPGMDGVETYHYIRKKLKGLHICFVSGYTLSEDASLIVRSDPKCESLTKPFSHKSLIEIIQQMLGESSENFAGQWL